MPNYSKNDILLVRYQFTDLSGTKVRPAVVVHAPHPSQDSFVVPLTSRLTALQAGEFALADWEKAGLNVPTAVKRGIYTIHPSLIVKFEAVYQSALAHELTLLGIPFQEQVRLQVVYKNMIVGEYRADFLSDGKVVPSTGSGQASRSKPPKA